MGPQLLGGRVEKEEVVPIPVQTNEQQFNEVEQGLIIRGGTMGKDQVEIKEIPIKQIKLARNSRLNVTDDEIAGLMQSIKQTGLLQPIGVVKSKTGGYEICYGNRRFLAISKLGKTKIPAIIHSHKTKAEDDLKNLTENIQRRNISLIEAGRYMELLKNEGLSYPEIAVRLGVTKSYVAACMNAYQEVPQKFRKDVDIKTTNDRKKEPGKISISAVKHILTASKQVGVTSDITEKLFEMAKTEEKFIPENSHRYAAALKAGSKNPMKDAKAQRKVAVQFWIDANDWEKLYDKHVTKGPFSSLNGYFVSILKGENTGNLKIRS